MADVDRFSLFTEVRERLGRALVRGLQAALPEVATALERSARGANSPAQAQAQALGDAAGTLRIETASRSQRALSRLYDLTFRMLEANQGDPALASDAADGPRLLASPELTGLADEVAAAIEARLGPACRVATRRVDALTRTETDGARSPLGARVLAAAAIESLCPQAEDRAVGPVLRAAAVERLAPRLAAAIAEADDWLAAQGVAPWPGERGGDARAGDESLADGGRTPASQPAGDPVGTLVATDAHGAGPVIAVHVPESEIGAHAPESEIGARDPESEIEVRDPEPVLGGYESEPEIEAYASEPEIDPHASRPVSEQREPRPASGRQGLRPVPEPVEPTRAAGPDPVAPGPPNGVAEPGRPPPAPGDARTTDDAPSIRIQPFELPAPIATAAGAQPDRGAADPAPRIADDADAGLPADAGPRPAAEPDARLAADAPLERSAETLIHATVVADVLGCQPMASGRVESGYRHASRLPRPEALEQDAVAFAHHEGLHPYTRLARQRYFEGLRQRMLAASVPPAQLAALDLVAAMFDYVVDDARMPAAAQPLLWRLQYPSVALAALDAGFLGDDRRSIRRLVENMAAISTAYADDVVQGSELFRRLETVVRAVEIVSHAFASRSTVLGEQVRREYARAAQGVSQLVSRIAKERSALESTPGRRNRRDFSRRPSREREQAVTRRLEGELLERLESRDVPDSAREFLLGVWLRHLRTAVLRDGDDSASYRLALSVVDDLLWSLDASGPRQSRRQLASRIPPLIRLLTQGVSDIGAKPEEFRPFLDELFLIHLRKMQKEPRNTEGAGGTEHGAASREASSAAPAGVGTGAAAAAAAAAAAMAAVPSGESPAPTGARGDPAPGVAPAMDADTDACPPSGTSRGEPTDRGPSLAPGSSGVPSTGSVPSASGAAASGAAASGAAASGAAASGAAASGAAASGPPGRWPALPAPDTEEGGPLPTLEERLPDLPPPDDPPTDRWRIGARAGTEPIAPRPLTPFGPVAVPDRRDPASAPGSRPESTGIAPLPDTEATRSLNGHRLEDPAGAASTGAAEPRATEPGATEPGATRRSPTEPGAAERDLRSGDAPSAPGAVPRSTTSVHGSPPLSDDDARSGDQRLLSVLSTLDLSDYPSPARRLSLPPDEVLGRLRRGDWLELIGRDGQPQDVKVAWINARRTVVLLVRRPDRRALSLRAAELVQRLEQGKATLIA